MKIKTKIVPILLLLCVFTSMERININANPTDWAIVNGVKQFYNARGEAIGPPNSKLVIDVSEHQGTINWGAVKTQNTGAFSVDGAILRLGYGSIAEDKQLANNLNGVRTQGIPYGAYLYSYAWDAASALEEAMFVESLVNKYGLNSMAYPIYYDLEKFTPYDIGYGKIYPPNSVAQYESITESFIGYLRSKGIYNVQLYSYRSLVENVMNSPKILPYMGWMAEYNYNLNFNNTYYSGLFGWQYSSTEKVNGINGNVDMSCFYDKGNIISLPMEITDKFNSQGLGYGNDYVSGFSLKITEQEANTNKIKALDSENYYISLTDSQGNIKDLSAPVTLKTGDLLKFKIKEGKDSNLKEYQFSVGVRGDINANGKIDAADYLMVMDTILNKYSMSGAQRGAGDINGNKKIDAADYLMIMDNILGKYDIK